LNQYQWLLLPTKCINDFFASSSANIKTGSVNVGDSHVELKPELINMVKQSSFCAKASDDANTRIQHFQDICSTFTIRRVDQDVVQIHLFSFSLLGNVKQWFYANRELVSTWEKCSNPFLTKFFLLGKTNSLGNKIPSFQQLTDKTIAKAWERLQDYIFACAHHGIEE
jgi:hypothetical protein